MTSTRMWSFASVLVIVALLLGTWFIGVSPKLAEASSANSERASVEAINSGHRAALADLKVQFENIDELRDELDELRVAVPGGAGIPDLISELHASAAAAGVSLGSITFGDPTPYVPTENATADPTLAAALASVTPENFLVIPVDLQIDGKYREAMSFVSALQSGDRLFLVHDLALAEGSMSSSSAASLMVSGQVFVLLDGAPAPADGGSDTAAVAAPSEGETPQ